MIERFKEALLSSEEQMSTLIFHVMTVAGSVFLMLGAVYTLLEGMKLFSVLGLLGGSIALAALNIIGRRTKKYEFCTVAVLLTLNVLALPFTYMSSGGIHSGMPLWFALGIVSLFLLLRKKWLWIVTAVSVLVDGFCVVFSYYHPEKVIQIDSEQGIYLDICISFIAATAAICFFVKVQSLLFENERRRFIEQQKLLDEALQTQSRFLANMSHEIRTPINTIIGLNEMTLREDISDEVAENSIHIQSASKMLLSLINDILDFSKIESGKMEIVEARYELGNMFSDIVNMNWSRAHEKNLAFEVYISENLPSMLYGDEIRIKQIVTNLLSNAIKYTSEGSITLSVDGEIPEPNQAILRISVSDTGMGIKRDDLDHLFETFRRVNEQETKGIEGTGLGLSITKQLAELMGGTITVDSVYHKGSTFTILLPQGIVDAAPVGKLNYNSSKTRRRQDYRKSFEAPEARVLVVDDNEMNLLVAKKLLRDSNVQLDLALSGDECLQLTTRHLYDIIFMDHIMPVMDGVETMQKVRNQVGGLNRLSPVIALTANAMSGAQEIYHQFGFSDYLAKPISSVLLESMLLKWLPESKIEYVLSGNSETQIKNLILKESKHRSKVMITTDSICDLPENVMKQLDIKHLHYYVNTEAGHFEESREIYSNSVLEHIAQGGTAHSEPPSAAEYEEFFSEMLQQAEQVIHISMGKASGKGYEQAAQAANSFAHVRVIDSGHLSSGMGLVVMAAAKFAMQNMDADEIMKRIEVMKQSVSTSFILENPDSLYHNGRLPKSVWRFAKYFSLHPVLKMKNSKISLSGILAGDMSRCSIKYVRKHMKGKRNIDTSVLFLTHANVSRENREAILAEVAKYQKFDKIYVVPASAAICCNCGEGCFGLLYCKTAE